jgi:predicted phage terminase large subunit-like protein
MYISEEERPMDNELDLRIKEQCEQSLRAFVPWAWDIIEPGNPLVSNWHLDAICDHLQAVYERDIIRLLILVPPRTAKSTIASKIFPSWAWIKDATEKLLTISNAENLALELGDDSKKIIDSDWYQNRWGFRPNIPIDEQKNYVQINPKINAKKFYANMLGGNRRPLGMKSTKTGKGGDILIFDDLHDTSEVESSVIRESVVETFWGTLCSRVNHRSGPRVSRRVGIQQRTHPDDVVGSILEREGDLWTVLKLPLEFNPRKTCVTGLNFKDPRTKKKESLDHKRLPPKVIAQIKSELGPIRYAAQCDQEPTAAGGNIIKLDNFKTYYELPKKEEILEVIQVWDTAQKCNKKDHSYWACGTWILTEKKIFLYDMFSERMDFPAGEEQIKYMYNGRFPDLKVNTVLIEDKSTGSSLLQTLPLDSQVVGIPVMGFIPDGSGDKETRMRIENSAIRAGLVYLPEEADWLHDFLIAMANFPNGKRQDIVDVVSMTLAHIKSIRLGGVRVYRLSDHDTTLKNRLSSYNQSRLSSHG